MSADDGWEREGNDGWEREPAKPKSTWEKISGMVPNPGRFLAESDFGQTAAALASGAVSAPVSGYAGILGTALGGPDKGADWVRATQEALTYEPKSKGAQKAVKGISYLPEKYAEFGDWAGRTTSDAFGPGAGAAVNALTQAAPAAFGVKLPGMRSSVFEKVLPGGELPGSAAKRNQLMREALQNDAAVAASRDAGFTLPPSRMNPQSWINNVLEGAGGKKELALDISAKNQPKSQTKIRDDLGIAPDEPLNLETYEAGRKVAGEAYPELTKAAAGAPYSEYPPRRGTGPGTRIAPDVIEPGIAHTPEFRADVGARRDLLRAKLEYKPEEFASLKPSLKLLDEALKGNEINHTFVVDEIKTLRSDAKADFKAENRADRLEMGRTRLDLANDIEALVEHNLTEKGDFTTLTKFRAARKEIAKSYDAEKATLSTGEIYAKALADAKKRGSPLTGGLAKIADLGAHFPEAAQIPSRTGATAINPLDLGLGILGHATGTGKRKLLPLAWAGARAPLRSMLMSETYQNLVRPQYGQSWASRPGQGLQQPGVIPGLQSLGLSERDQEILRQLMEQGAPQ